MDMNPAAMMEMLGSVMGGAGKDGAKGMPGMPEGMDAAGLQEMMNMMKQVDKDPALKREMEGYWKMLDNMNESDPSAYKKHIDEQMKDMKEHKNQEYLEGLKQKTITSNPYFSFSVRPAKLVDQTKEPAKATKDDIKLFDFGSGD